MGFKSFTKNLALYSVTLTVSMIPIGALTYLLRDKPLSKKEFDELNKSEVMSIYDYSRGVDRPLEIVPVDSNDDGRIDALCIDFPGVKVARWYGSDWKGYKTPDAQPMTLEIEELVNEQLRAKRNLSSLLFEEGIKQRKSN